MLLMGWGGGGGGGGRVALVYSSMVHPSMDPYKEMRFRQSKGHFRVHSDVLVHN